MAEHNFALGFDDEFVNHNPYNQHHDGNFGEIMSSSVADIFSNLFAQSSPELPDLSPDNIDNILYCSPAVPAISHSFKINNEMIPDKFYKTQIRSQKNSMQRIKDGEISFTIEFDNEEAIKNIHGIIVKVKRTMEHMNDAASAFEVPIDAHLSVVQSTKVLLKLNLDSVYEHKDCKVYSLDKCKDRKLFHLKVEVRFNDNNLTSQTTKSFRIIGKKRDKPQAGVKRKHANSTTSESSNGSNDANNEDIERIIQCSKVVTDHIETKTMAFGGILVGQVIQTGNGDIAYHFLQKDPTATFEEGEVVGFVYDDNKECVLVKLTFSNASDAILKGVISRSYYLEARKPKTNVRSETVCFLGIVPVQVMGSVRPNEALYASPYHPGLAVSSYHLDSKSQTEAALIGFSFSAYKTDDENSVGIVQAGVSVLETASRFLQQARLRQFEDEVDEKIGSIEVKNIKSRRRICCCLSLFGIFVLLSAIFLWQYLIPGSAFRYAVCNSGSLSGTAHYNFIPMRNIYAYPRVNGTQFDYDTLVKKLHKVNYHRLNVTGCTYYLNIDRCAYADDSAKAPLANLAVYGPDMFAVDEKCFYAYYFDEPNARWKRYNSVSWTKRQNIYCQPRSKWKHPELM